MKFIFFNFIIIFSIIFSQTVKSKENNDSLCLKNSFKLDLMPLYNTFFDTRIQVRAGIEYERKINFKSFLSGYLDIGIYDKYVFRKYYDFFNENGGMYFVDQDVAINGFHMIPGYNYFIFQSKRKTNQGLFLGGNIDFNFYRKKLKFYNSQTFEKYTQKYNQSKLALGLSLGWKWNLDPHFFIELQTSMFAVVLKNTSAENVKAIRPIISQWNDPKYNYWWVSNLKICYAFRQ